MLRKVRKQAHDAIGQVADADAALVNAELDRLGGKTQLVQTIGERIAHCATLIRPAGYLTVEKGVFPPSVFETASNPNGIIRSAVARDLPRPPLEFDDGAAFVPGAAEFGLDAFVAAMGAPGSAGAGAGVPASAGMGAQQAQHQTMGTGSTPAPAQQQPQPRPQDFDWIEGFLSGSGGASTEPVPSTAEMDANWQSLVDQLGL